MPVYLTLSEGPTGSNTRPLFATSDPDIIIAVLEIVAERVEKAMEGKVVKLPVPE